MIYLDQKLNETPIKGDAKMTNQTQVKHTPTPWKLYKDKNGARFIQNPKELCTICWVGNEWTPGDWEAQANAQFIVKAVNCHDELFDVLVACKEELIQRGYNEEDNLLLRVEEALRKAGA